MPMAPSPSRHDALPALDLLLRPSPISSAWIRSNYHASEAPPLAAADTCWKPITMRRQKGQCGGRLAWDVRWRAHARHSWCSHPANATSTCAACGAGPVCGGECRVPRPVPRWPQH